MSYTEFQNLNLSDDFLFAKVMEDEAVLHPVVEKILDIRIREMTIVQSQRMIEIEPDSKGIRLDIMADDVAGSRYTVEMQNENEYNINKRSRYYHSMMDLDLLEKGKKYNRLQKNIVIFICTFQPFVRSGRHRYFFEKRCVQEPELALEDGVTTVILSTKGTKKDIDEEMAAFLRYVEDSSEEVADRSDSSLVKLIHAKVCTVKQSKVREAEYMKLQERDQNNFQRGWSEGLRKGRSEGLREGRSEGLREGKRQGELLNIIQMTRALLRQGKSLNTLTDLLETDAKIAGKIAGLILENENLSDEEILKKIIV